MMSKKELRELGLRSRRLLAADEMKVASGAIVNLLLRLPEVVQARVVATYVAKIDEVQTAGFIEAALKDGKTVLVPRADREKTALFFSEIRSMSDLSPGAFGVLEPRAGTREASLDEAQMVAVPIVAWDERGGRLGYGKGYFDRALAATPGPTRVGLALEAQRKEGLPQTAFDVPLDVVITEERVLRFGRR